MQTNKEEFDKSMQSITLLITGVSGFIGFHLALRFLQTNLNIQIVGIDNMSDYYDISLKEHRLRKLLEYSSFQFTKGDLSDKDTVMQLFEDYNPRIVIHLAAQAGVRHSITHPDDYIKSNIIGFYNVLEAVRHSYDKGKKGVKHLIFASSSSVYGNNRNVPYSTNDKTDMPVSLYAATKKSNELMAYSYSKLYGIPITGLRFFTVYGPMGRPDMAYFSFTNKLLKGEKIQLFNYGNCERDFTYIDDVIECIYRIVYKIPKCNADNNGFSTPAYIIYNIGKSHPENLLHFVNTLRMELVRAKILPASFDLDKHIEFVRMQQGDVPTTYAEVSALEHDFGFVPSTPLQNGLRRFVEWYKKFYLC